MLPICLENEDIKENEGEDLLFYENSFSLNNGKDLTMKGIPVDTEDYSPLIILIPHLRS